MKSTGVNDFDKLLDRLEIDNKTYKFYNLNKLNDERYGK